MDVRSNAGVGGVYRVLLMFGFWVGRVVIWVVSGGFGCLRVGEKSSAEVERCDGFGVNTMNWLSRSV